MLTNLIEIDRDKLINEVTHLKNDGYRLSAVTCENLGDNLELTYHFDYKYELKNLRIVVPPGEAVESISSVYLPAFLIENEFQDLYGIKFNNILVDYKGKLYLTDSSPKTPMLG